MALVVVKGLSLQVSHIAVYKGCAAFITEGPNAIKRIRPRAAPSFHAGCLEEMARAANGPDFGRAAHNIFSGWILPSRLLMMKKRYNFLS